MYVITHGTLHINFTKGLKFEHNLTKIMANLHYLFFQKSTSCFGQSIVISSMYALHAAFLMKTFL